jgi:hypothetical protein
MHKKRSADPGDSKRSRRRTGWCEFSARLFLRTPWLWRANNPISDFAGPTGAIGSLFVGRGIVIDENALGHQIGKHLVAFVAQEKRLAAVADENESVMPNRELAHITLQKNDASFTIGTRHSRTKASLHCALSNRQARATLLLRRIQ